MGVGAAPSSRDGAAHLGNVAFWAPYVAGILERHRFVDAGRAPVAGFNPTHPTFVCGDVVVKLFGCSRLWRVSHRAERAALTLVASDPKRDLFDCDKALLRAFLEASGWPVGESFPNLALGHGLWRQALGIVQHDSMDVFEPVAARFPLQAIGTLEELASALFAV